ncbi:MAG: hypothetical protein ACJA13_002578 [Paraglaciecola sp.]|jgi:hypothetical protein
MEDLLNYSKVIASIITALSFIFGAYIYFANSRKDRIKDTLTYWEGFYREIKPSVQYFSTHAPSVEGEVVKNIAAHKTDKNKLHDILNNFEKLALGVNLGAYDLNSLNRVAGKTILQLYERYEQYIHYRRRDPKTSNSWSEFEMLYTRLKKIRKH